MGEFVERDLVVGQLCGRQRVPHCLFGEEESRRCVDRWELSDPVQAADRLCMFADELARLSCGEQSLGVRSVTTEAKSGLHVARAVEKPTVSGDCVEPTGLPPQSNRVRRAIDDVCGLLLREQPGGRSLGSSAFLSGASLVRHVESRRKMPRRVQPGGLVASPKFLIASGRGRRH
jgi:hypothetical protein